MRAWAFPSLYSKKRIKWKVLFSQDIKSRLAVTICNTYCTAKRLFLRLRELARSYTRGTESLQDSVYDNLQYNLLVKQQHYLPHLSPSPRERRSAIMIGIMVNFHFSETLSIFIRAVSDTRILYPRVRILWRFWQLQKYSDPFVKGSAIKVFNDCPVPNDCPVSGYYTVSDSYLQVASFTAVCSAPQF